MRTNIIADRLDRLAERGPRADPALVVARATALASGGAVARDSSSPRRGRRLALAAACVILVVSGVGLIANVAGRPTSAPPAPASSDVVAATTASGPSSSRTSEPGTVPLEPVEVLGDRPDLSDVPVTVQGPAPTDWYRLQADLDVAWYSDTDGQPNVCFRTPIYESGMREDLLRPVARGGLPVGIVTAGDQLLVVTVDDGDIVTLTLDQRFDSHRAGATRRPARLGRRPILARGTHRRCWAEHVVRIWRA